MISKPTLFKLRNPAIKNLSRLFSAFSFVLLFSISLSQKSTAQAVAIEQFAYTASATDGLNKQSDGTWQNINTGDSILISSGSLTYPGLVPSAGNKVAFDADGTDCIQSISPISTTGTTIYYSFLLRISALGSLNTSGGYFTGISSGTTNYASTVFIRRNTSTSSRFNLGISSRSTSAILWLPDSLNTNTVYLIVTSYTLNPGTGNDVSKIWINPTSLGAATEPTANGTAVAGTDMSSVNGILLRQSNASGTPFVEMDELRLGTSWSSVTPAAAATCIRPSSQPKDIVYSNIGSNQVSGSFTPSASGADKYLILMNNFSGVNPEPLDSNSYLIGSDVDDAVVVDLDDNSTFTLDSLSPSTTYFLYIYAFNDNCTGGPLYQLDSPLISFFTTTSGLSPCPEPQSQPTSLVFSNIQSNQLQGDFTASLDADEYLIVQSTSSTLTALPVDGSAYQQGDLIGNGKVVSKDAATTFIADSLNAQTTYYFFIFSIRSQNCTQGPNYQTLNPLSGNATTISLSGTCVAPSNQPTNLVLTGNNNSINGTFTQTASADGYLVLYSTSSTLTQSPINQVDYSSGNTIGNATVVYAGSNTQFFQGNLSANVRYYFFVFAKKSNCVGGTRYNLSNPLTGNFQTAASAEFQYYYGNLHAHSSYSDGNKDGILLTPAQDYEYAKESLQMDFLGISEHNHSGAGMARSNYFLGVSQANAATSSDFVALYGQEWGVISGGGHVLVYGVDSLIGWETNNYHIFVAKSDYTGVNGLFKKLNARPNSFATYAHPNSSDYNNISNIAYNVSVDSAVAGCAVESGPAFSTATNYSDFPASMSYLSYYLKMLSKGYHLGPLMDHDTHYTNFGRANENRMVVLAPSLTKNNLIAAIKARRFYATQDMDTRVTYTINNNPMGSIITGGTAPIISAGVTDPTSPTATRTIRLMYGIPGSGVLATQLASSTTGTLSYTDNALATGVTRYYYLDITVNGRRTITAPIWYTKSNQVSPTMSLSAGNTLTESNLNNSQLTIALSNTTFSNPASLSASSFTLINAPAGLSVGSISGATSNAVTLTLAYNNADFDVNVSGFGVSIASSALASGTTLSANNLSISANVETISISTVTGFGNQLFQTNSSKKNVSISGLLLSSNVSVTAPAGFQVSLDSTTGYTQSLSIAPVSGSVNRTIYVRFSPSAPIAYNGNLSVSNSKTTTQTISLSGIGFQVFNPCDSLLFNSTVYRTNGFYNTTFIRPGNTDSTVYFQLTLRTRTMVNSSVQSCSTFVWNGQTLTTNGTYQNTRTNVAGCDSVETIQFSIIPCPVTLNLNLFLQGYYTGNGRMSTPLFDNGSSADSLATDSIIVSLWNADSLNTPNPTYSLKTILKKNGQATALFSGVNRTKNYFISIRNRNSLETWSSIPLNLQAIANYNFADSMNRAFSNGSNTPMQALGSNRFALYSGDVNQDGTIDFQDLQVAENKSAEFSFDYDKTDLNGDGATDLIDLQIAENNGSLFIFFARPN
jgi:hypothetical protein